MNHTHPDTDRLTFGCQACVQRVRDEAWRTAPERIVWLRALVPPYVLTRNGKPITWTFPIHMRVPDGVTAEQLDESGRVDDGEGFAASMPEWMTDDQRMDVMGTAITEVVRIEDIKPEPVAQPSLFGGDPA